jgi:hypothetical protein
MPANPVPLPERDEAEPDWATAQGDGTDPDVPVIRQQAQAIIDAVMSGSGSEGAAARKQLRAFVEAHPGQPEVALAEHLLALRTLPESGQPES